MIVEDSGVRKKYGFVVKKKRPQKPESSVVETQKPESPSTETPTESPVDPSPERPAIDDSSSCPSTPGSAIEITVPIDHKKSPEQEAVAKEINGELPNVVTPVKPAVIPKEQYSSIGKVRKKKVEEQSISEIVSSVDNELKMKNKDPRLNRGGDPRLRDPPKSILKKADEHPKNKDISTVDMKSLDEQKKLKKKSIDAD